MPLQIPGQDEIIHMVFGDLDHTNITVLSFGLVIINDSHVYSGIA